MIGTELMGPGFFIFFQEEIEVPEKKPAGGRGTGPIRPYQGPGYNQHREDALRETRHKRILQEDEDIVSLIMAMVTNRLM